MKRKRFSEAQIIGVLKEAEAGVKNRSSAGNMGSPSRHSTGGGPSTGACRCPTSRG